jgi:hypothetical protein
MVFDDNATSRPLPDLLINKLPAEEPSTPALSLFQIQCPISIGVYRIL